MTFDMNKFGRMSAEQRKEAMGLSPTAHLPNENLGPFTIHGIEVRLADRATAIALGASKRKPQRVLAHCPDCGKLFAAGNLAQHYNIHTESGREWLRRKEQRKAETKAYWAARRA